MRPKFRKTIPEVLWEEIDWAGEVMERLWNGSERKVGAYRTWGPGQVTELFLE